MLLFLLIWVKTHLENYSSSLISVAGNSIPLLPYDEKRFSCVCVRACVHACVHSCFEEKENIEAILKGKHRSHQHCPIVLGCLHVGPPNSHHCLWLYGPSTRCPPRSQGSWLCSSSHPWASVTPAADTTSPPTFTKVVSVHGAAGGSVPRPGAP